MPIKYTYENLPISHYSDGAIGDNLDNYVNWLKGSTYSPRTIVSYLIAAERFLEWLKMSGNQLSSIDDGAVANYRAVLRKDKPVGYCDGGNLYCGARQLVKFLRSTGKIPLAKNVESPLLEEFKSWMVEQRGSANSTLETYSRTLRQFLKALGDKPEEYDARQLRQFVLRSSQGFSHSHTESIVTAVRMFVRFLIATQRCAPALKNAIPRLAKWSKATLPKYLAPELIDRVIAECDPLTTTGSRDRAILLLLSRLALRASDISGLQIEDIDWQNARLSVCGKSQRRSYLPLPQDAGVAVLHYLDVARPVVAHRSVFCIVHAPFTPMNGHTVSHMAGRYIRRSGIDSPSYGAHLFRHSTATALLRQGLSLDSVGALLRHQDLDTTAIYAKVDTPLLQAIALPWLEENISC